MSRCFPFPPPGYGKEKKSSNGELGHLHKKKKHKDKKEKKKNKKEESKDEDKVNHVTEKKDKKHRHHKHKKDKRKGRHGELEFDDIKRVGVAQDSPTRRGPVSILFVERERQDTGRCNKVDISDSEGSRQNRDKIRDNGMEGNQKMDKDRGKSDGNVRKRKEIDTNFFLGVGVAEDSLNKRETIGFKFVANEKLGNGMCDKIDPSEREESRQNNYKTRDNSMEEDQKTGKDGGKSNGIVRKRMEIDTESSLHGGNAQESPKKRETVSIKFVERERLCNGKCDKINLLDNQKFHTDRDNNNGIVRKGNEIDTNFSLHGNRLWVHLPVLTDKDKRSTKHFQTTLAKEVYSDIGRTAQETKKFVVECNHALGKSVDSTSVHPSLSGKDKWSSKGLQTTFTKEVYFNTDKTVQKVKDGPVECIRKTRSEEASNASFDKCIASTSCYPSFSGKDKQFNKCPRAACAKEVHSDIGNKMQDAKACAVGCIPESTVQEVSKASLEKCVASVSCHPSITGKEKHSNKRSRTASIEDFHSDSWRKVQDSKDSAVECLSESTIQEVSKASLEKCVASVSCHPSITGKEKHSNKRSRTASIEDFHSDSWRKVQDLKDSVVECLPESTVQEVSKASLEKSVASVSCHPSITGKEKRSNKRSRTASIEDFHSDSWRKVQDSKDSAVECLPESRIQWPSNAAPEKCVASTSCHPTFVIKDKRSIKHPRTVFPEEVLFDSGRIGQEANAVAVECKPGSRVQEASTATLQKCVTSTSCLPSFSGKDCERNGEADCKTTLHFVGPSHGTTEAVDIVPSGSGTDEHMLDLKYFQSVLPKQGCSDLDDQAWLFPSNSRKRKATEKFDHASTVWDRLLVLPANNTYALPYVTPF